MVCSFAISSNCVWLQITFRSYVKKLMADRFASRRYSLKTNLVIEWKNNYWIRLSQNIVSASCRSIICLILRLRQIIDQLATDKSPYFAQPRPIIVNYLLLYLAGVKEKPRKVIINGRIDYEQSFFSKWPRAWLKARDGPPTFLASRGFGAQRSRARALPLLNLKKKRDCSQSNERMIWINLGFWETAHLLLPWAKINT